MRKSYIKRLNNYSYRIQKWGLERYELERAAEVEQRLGNFRLATSLRARAEKASEREHDWDIKAVTFVEKMTQEEYYASRFPSEQCMSYEDCTGLYD